MLKLLIIVLPAAYYQGRFSLGMFPETKVNFNAVSSTLMFKMRRIFLFERINTYFLRYSVLKKK